MKKELPSWMTITSGVIALLCLIAAMANAAKLRAAEKETSALRGQLANMEAYVPDEIVSTNPVIVAESIDTNDVEVLKALLVEKQAEIVELIANPVVPQREERPPRESWEDRMARMKAEEPEQYAEMIQRREERQKEMRYNLAERTATFMDLDTSQMTEKERANHEALVERMAKVWELSEQFQDPEAPPNREAMRELFSEMREVRPLMEQERTIMFKQLGTDLGYAGQDATDFAAHVEDIIGATSLQMPGHGRRGRSRGGGGGR